MSVVQKDPAWNCVAWVKEALAALQKDSKTIGTAKLDWEIVRDAATGYCQKQIDDNWFDGKARFGMKRPATYDILDKKETVL